MILVCRTLHSLRPSKWSQGYRDEGTLLETFPTELWSKIPKEQTNVNSQVNGKEYVYGTNFGHVDSIRISRLGALAVD
jgi:hypothetical protein